MEYLILAMILAAILIGIVYFRARPSNDLNKSVEDFQRARKALDPTKSGTRHQRR